MNELKECLYCGSENEVNFEYGYGFVNCTNNKCVGIGVIKENDFNEEVVDIHNNAYAFKIIEKQNKIIANLKEQRELLKTEVSGLSSFVFIEYSKRQLEIEELENE